MAPGYRKPKPHLHSLDCLDERARPESNGDHGLINRAEVYGAIQGLLDPDRKHEIRALGPRQGQARSKVIRRDDQNALEIITGLADANGVYFSLNPVRPDLGEDEAASAVDIIERHNLMIDCDPVKAVKYGMATEKEKGHAFDLAARIREHLTNVLVWPDPAVIDSGNGMHLDYLVVLPNDQESKLLLQSILKELARQFDNEHAKVDIAVHDASRIAKLPGTWVRKGPDTPERPHRMARLVFMPTHRIAVSRDRLEAVLPKPADLPPTTPTDTHWTIPGNGDLINYVRGAIDGEIAKLKTASLRNNALNTAAFNLSQLEGWPEFDGEAVKALLRQTAIDIGLESDPNCRLSGIDKTIDSGWTKGSAQPRTWPDRKRAGSNSSGTRESKSSRTQSKDSQDSQDSLTLCTSLAKTYRIKPVEFLDGGIIPAGKMISIVGMGGAGKGMFWANLVAEWSRGCETLGMKYQPTGPIEILLVGCEDGYEDTVIPRLMAANANLDNIHVLKGVKDKDGKVKPFSLEYLDPTARWLAGHPRVRFTVIDPLPGYVARAGVDDHSDAELRSILEPFSDLGNASNVTFCGIKHFNKDESKSVAARVGGSVAYVNVARACYVVGVDPTNPYRRVLAPFKWNLNVPWPPSIAWSQELADSDVVRQVLQSEQCKGLTTAQIALMKEQLFRLRWEGEVNVKADDVLERISASGRKSQGGSGKSHLMAGRSAEERTRALQDLRRRG